MLKDTCAYFRIFETEISAGHIPYLKGVRKVPHPFVLTPPLNGKTLYEPGEKLKIQLRLFGSAVQLLQYYVFVFQQIGKRGFGRADTLFEVLEFNAVIGNEVVPVITPDGKTMTADLPTLRVPAATEENFIGFQSVNLEFTTPVRIQEAGKVLLKKDNVTPAVILNGLYRRYLALAGLYGNGGFLDQKPDFPYEEIEVSSNSLAPFDWGRYSNRQKNYLDMSGLIGSISLSGNILPAIPWLLAGSRINMGKNTAYGLGQFRVVLS
ncbi:MAG: hypothetical protein IFNCLDLE_01023 [Ignavibacteriaceae bacterium]|nr:hypothetical protein [Ignavibacteriaceae bacterium]